MSRVLVQSDDSRISRTAALGICAPIARGTARNIGLHRHDCFMRSQPGAQYTWYTGPFDVQTQPAAQLIPATIQALRESAGHELSVFIARP